MDFLQHLNHEQREAVLHTDGPLLVLAGAGSGKTRVISYRTAYLVGSGHAGFDQVLAVTFTNKAADEMRERVGSLLGSDCSRLWISTFHAFCARVLRREAPAIGLSRHFVIYDASDQLSIVRQALRALRADEKLLQPRLVLARISRAKNQMQGPDGLKEEGGSHRDEVIAAVYERYSQALTESAALDFDDLLLKTVELFDTSEHTRARYANRFRFVMVDEYQDTNRPQYRMIRQLADGHRNLCVVGDPDQSIYTWRGADLRNIMDFEADFPETKVVRLERNYRSTQIILDAASGVITQNRARKEKALWTDRDGGARVEIYRAADELAEADFITARLRSALAEDTGSAAVLYRTNAQSRAIEDALLRDGLGYKIIGGVRFYERKEVKDALAYLRLISNAHDDVSLRRVINVPPRGIGKGVMEGMAGLEAPASSKSLWARLVRATEDRLLPARATASLAAFRELIATLAEVGRRESVAITLGKVLDQTGYLDALREERSEEAEGRLANLMELVSSARDYEVREPEPSLAAFVDRLSLLSDVDQEEGSRDARISLLTLHSAKGLEFPVVVMAGLEEGLFPHFRSREDVEQLEEERRLCYVGMTRAQSRLILTSAARRRVFGEYQKTESSRFLDEVPIELVERIEPAVASPFQNRLAESEFRIDPYARRGRRSSQAHERFEPAYAYEDEDQSVAALRPGMSVRHPTFGLGTVLSVEPLSDDLKLTVRFSDIGRKTLRAKYARLELA